MHQPDWLSSSFSNYLTSCVLCSAQVRIDSQYLTDLISQVFNVISFMYEWYEA